MAFYQIYLKNFHGKGGCIELTLEDAAQLREDYEQYLSGKGYPIRSYPRKLERGQVVIDFREVAAIVHAELP